MKVPNPIPCTIRDAWRTEVYEPVKRRYNSVATSAEKAMDNFTLFNIHWFGGDRYIPGHPMESYPPEYICKLVERSKAADVASLSSDTQPLPDSEAGLSQSSVEGTTQERDGKTGDTTSPMVRDKMSQVGLHNSIRGQTPNEQEAIRALGTASSVVGARTQAGPNTGTSTPDSQASTPSNAVTALSGKSFRSLVKRGNSTASSWKEVVVSPGRMVKSSLTKCRRQGQKSSPKPPGIQLGSQSTMHTFLFMVAKMMGVAILPMIPAYEKLGVAIGILVTVVAMTVSGIASRCIWQFTMRHPLLKNVADVTAQLFASFGCAIAGFYFGWAEYFIYNLLIMTVHLKFGSNVFHFPIDGKQPLGVWTTDTLVTLTLSLICSILCFLPRRIVSRLGAFSGLLTLSFIGVFFFALFKEGPVDLSFDDMQNSEVKRSFIHAVYNYESSLSEKMTAVLRIQFATLIASSVPMMTSDMGDPRNFPKALVGHKIILTSVLILFGSASCSVLTPQHTVLEPWRMIPNPWGKVAAGLMFFPGVLQGQIYGIVNAQPLMNKFGHGESAGMTSRNLVVMGAIWLLAWIGTQVVPGLSNLMCFIGGVFGCAFGTLSPALTKLAVLGVDVKVFGVKHLWRPQGIRKMIIVVGLLTAACFFAFASKFAVEDVVIATKDTEFIPFRPDPKSSSTTSTAAYEAMALPSVTSEDTATPTVFLAQETDADYYGW